MHVEQTNDRLILRYTNHTQLVIGVFLVLAGIFVIYGALGGYVNLREQDSWIKPASLVMGLGLIPFGFWTIIYTPSTTTTIYPAARNITIESRSLSNRSVNQYSFDRVQEFRVVEVGDGEGGHGWIVALRLRNNSDVPLIINSFLYKQSKTEVIAATANSFLQRKN